MEDVDPGLTHEQFFYAKPSSVRTKVLPQDMKIPLGLKIFSPKGLPRTEKVALAPHEKRKNTSFVQKTYFSNFMRKAWVLIKTYEKFLEFVDELEQ